MRSDRGNVGDPAGSRRHSHAGSERAGSATRLFPERRRKKLVETFADLISCLSLPLNRVIMFALRRLEQQIDVLKSVLTDTFPRSPHSFPIRFAIRANIRSDIQVGAILYVIQCPSVCDVICMEPLESYTHSFVKKIWFEETAEEFGRIT